jgi:hypothetical protein
MISRCHPIPPTILTMHRWRTVLRLNLSNNEVYGDFFKWIILEFQYMRMACTCSEPPSWWCKLYVYIYIYTSSIWLRRGHFLCVGRADYSLAVGASWEHCYCMLLVWGSTFYVVFLIKVIYLKVFSISLPKIKCQRGRFSHKRVTHRNHTVLVTHNNYKNPNPQVLSWTAYYRYPFRNFTSLTYLSPFSSDPDPSGLRLRLQTNARCSCSSLCFARLTIR